MLAMFGKTTPNIRQHWTAFVQPQVAVLRLNLSHLGKNRVVLIKAGGCATKFRLGKHPSMFDSI